MAKDKFMSRQMLVSLSILVLTFVSGLAVGLFLGGGAPSASVDSEETESSSSHSVSPSLEAQERIEGNTLLSNRIRELEKELAGQKENQKTILADRMAFFKKYQQSIRVGAFDGDLNVTPEMAEILGLSKEEQQTLRQHLEETKSEIDKFEDANTTLVKQTANGVAYEIPINPDGKALSDKLNSLVISDIGAARAEMFMSDGDFSSYNSFADFGQQKKEIEISWAQQDGKTRYTVKNSFFGPDGNSKGWSSSTGDAMPQQYQKLLQGNSAP
jgi:hypothetical protein